jgi:hypothetical protein
MHLAIDRPPLDQPAVGTDLTAIAVLGAADVALFLWSRRRTIFTNSPSRAAGAAAGLCLWSAMGISSGISASRPRARGWRRATVGLGLLCGVGNLALFAVHMRLGKGGVRSIPGAGLGLATLASVWRWGLKGPER